MSDSVYMKFPGIEGDVTSSGFEKTVQLLSFDFSVARKLNTQPGRVSEREGSKPVISEITLTKRLCKTSPLLFGKSTKGLSAKQVEIDFVKTDKTPTKYLSYTLDNVMVSSHSVSYQERKDADGKVESVPVETFKLNFTAVEMSFIPSGSDGKPQSQISDRYDIATAA